MSQIPSTKAASFTLRDGEGVLIGAWELRIVQLMPYPMAAVDGPPGSFRQGLFKGVRFQVGPARVVCTDVSHGGRRRVRLNVSVAADVKLSPLAREEFPDAAGE